MTRITGTFDFDVIADAMIRGTKKFVAKALAPLDDRLTVLEEKQREIEKRISRFDRMETGGDQTAPVLKERGRNFA